MAAPELADYRGTIEPSDLPEPVVFRSGLQLPLSLGVMVGFLAFVVLGLVSLAYWLVVDPLHPISRDPILAASWLLGATTFLALWLRWRGFQMVVSREGIVVSRHGAILQECAWEDATVRVRGAGMRRSATLCDQYGRPFSVMWVEARHPDRILALRAIRSRAAQLAGAQTPAPSRRRAWWMTGLALAVGAVGVVLLPGGVRRFVALVGEPDATPAQRGLALGLVLLYALMASCGFVVLELSPVFFLAWAMGKERKKRHKLVEFIAARKGLLNPVEMREGVWYRYVAPKDLRSGESGLVGGVTMLVFAVLVGVTFAIGCHFSSDQFPAGLVAVMFLMVGVFGVSGWVVVERGVRLRRGLGAEFMLYRSGLQVKFPRRQPVPYRLVRHSKRPRSESTTLGSVWWLLRSPQGKPLLLDPRYLVPVQ